MNTSEPMVWGDNDQSVVDQPVVERASAPNRRRGSSLSTLSFRLLVAVLFFAPSLAGAAVLNIEDYRWNLDGVVRHEEFNQLSIIVTNTAADDFDGVLEYRSGMGVTPTFTLRQNLFLGSEQTTRLVFDVYVGGYAEDGLLRWGEAENEASPVNIPTAIWSDIAIEEDLEARQLPPVVWIETTVSGTPPVGGSVRPLPARLFPITATSLPTDGVVALSETPEWQPAQRQALADWVKLGGTLLVFERGGEFPEFSDELAFLNLNTPRRTIGRGLVIHESMNARSLAADQWRDYARAVPRGESRPDQEVDEYSYNYSYNIQQNFAQAMYEGMSIVHRPQVVWVLIFLMFFIYIASVTTGGLVVSRKTRDWKATYATLGLLVVLFSGLFWYVGKRGHGEESEAMTLAVVDVIDVGDDRTPPRARVHGWTQYFTTGSGEFVFQPHSGRASTDGRVGFRSRESGLGETVIDGPDGAMAKSVPVFSAASFQWQSVGALTIPKPTRVTFNADTRFVRATIEGLSPDAVVRFVRGDKVIDLRRESGGSTYVGKNWQTLIVPVALEPQAYSLSHNIPDDASRDTIRNEVLEAFDKWANSYALLRPRGGLTKTDLDAGVLLITEPLPDELAVSYDDGAAHDGRVLYRVGVPLAVTP